MYTIYLSDLVFSGAHGAHKKEKQRRQNFKVDLTLDVKTVSKEYLPDKLSGVVDYGPIREKVRSVIENHSFSLIENIVHAIAEQVLNDRRITKVSVRLTKLDIWGNGAPSIEMAFPNEHNHPLASTQSPKARRPNRA